MIFSITLKNIKENYDDKIQLDCLSKVISFCDEKIQIEIGDFGANNFIQRLLDT